jgi:hypothetical protein
MVDPVDLVEWALTVGTRQMPRSPTVPMAVPAVAAATPVWVDQPS